MSEVVSRREFLRTAVAVIPVAAVVKPSTLLAGMSHPPSEEPVFKISLAEWSLHRALYAGELDNLDFTKIARVDYGLDAVEYVNSFFKDKAENRGYLKELKGRADDHGVTSLLIMCDGEGAIGDPDDAARTTAVKNHYRWVEAAKYLGCHSIRVNAQSEGSPAEQRQLAADGLRRLTEFAEPYGLNVVVENHGGLSSNGKWLSSVIKAVDSPRCGTLPDFGNFYLHDDEWYDRYVGIAELMPYAKAVSAKSHDFHENGDELHTNYTRMLRVVLDAGYRGYIGIEYEGSDLSESDGIRATLTLLERTREMLSEEYS